MNTKLYPESGVELTPFIAKHYDKVMNIGSFGMYHRFIANAVKDIEIKPTDAILDLGCGTGRNAALMLKYLGGEGKIKGVDLSPEMQEQFEKRFSGEKRTTFRQQRIDILLTWVRHLISYLSASLSMAFRMRCEVRLSKMRKNT